MINKRFMQRAIKIEIEDTMNEKESQYNVDQYRGTVWIPTKKPILL